MSSVGCDVMQKCKITASSSNVSTIAIIRFNHADLTIKACGLLVLTSADLLSLLLLFTC